MRRRAMGITAGATALAVVMAAGLAVSGSATAGKAPPAFRGVGCPDGKLCLWEDNEGGGQRVAISGKRGVSNKLAKRMNNEASSLINATDHRVYVYDKRDAKGDVRCYGPGDEVADMGADSGFNDVASSTKVTRGDTCPVDDPHRGGAGDCSKGTRALCVWAGPKGSGELVKIRGKGISNKLFKRMNNEATSAYNGRGKAAFLYDSKNGDGESVCVEPHDGIGDLGAYAFDNRATSSKNAAHGSCPV